MLIWAIAVVAGIGAAVLAYGARPAGLARLAALARLIAIAGSVALLLDAAAGIQRVAVPIVALDASASWSRGRDTGAFRAAFTAATSDAADSLLLFGDSVRGVSAVASPNDRASRVRPVVEQALATGRPLVLYTDGELDDAAALSTLPRGSRVVVAAAATGRDAALTDLRSPRAVVTGDTLEVLVTVAAGGGGASPGNVQVSLGERAAPPVALDSLGAYAERTVRSRLLVPSGTGPTLLRAVLTSRDDVEPRNDTVAVAIDLAPGAGAVLVSTSPDLDVRELTTVLRGTVSLPTRGFFRVAPGVWREEGTLVAVTEDQVRRWAKDAPVLVLHGDTSVFGAPRSNSRGSLMLFAPPTESTGEWYATGAPPSPVASAMTGSSWDSLPPLEVSPNVPIDGGVSEVLETRRARRLERRVAIVAWERPRRIVVVGASGFWRWRFRGGAGVGVHTALWGSLLDWLAAEHSDTRAAVPINDLLRAGETVRWRRGSASDTAVQAILVRRGDNVTDTLSLRFAPGITSTETAPLDRGVYDVRVRGGSALLVVNESAELLPRRASVHAGNIGEGVALGDTPRLRTFGWLFALLIAALCAEWILRRRMGLR
ncbi:MAG: hypothetical protein ABI877_06625 [Gemmatimonadaceae bacterium]